MQRIFKATAQLAGWAAIAIIAFVTLTKISVANALYARLAPLMGPMAGVYQAIVHVTAFALFGAIFSLAYRRRLLLTATVVFGSAIALEFLQTLTPDRHGTLLDAFEKLAGGAFGIAAAHLILRVMDRRRFSRNLASSGARTP